MEARSPRAGKAALASTSPTTQKHRVLSPTKPTLHLSPRKFHALQQHQRNAVLRGMRPLSPLMPRQVQPAAPPQQDEQYHNEPPRPPQQVMWNPAWLPFPVDSVATATATGATPQRLTLGSMSLDQWLQSFDAEVLQYESLEQFAQVKLPEALAFCDKVERQIQEAQVLERAAWKQQQACGQSSKPGAGRHPVSSAMTRFPVRFRVAVFANVVERAVLAMTQSASLGHVRPWLLQARQELFRAVFADYDAYAARRGTADEEDDETRSDSSDEDDEDDPSAQKKEEDPSAPGDGSVLDRFGPETPRSLNFFLSRVPFVLKLEDDSQRRSARFQRHQVVLRRIVQSLYRSLGTVFHAWKQYVQRRKEERLHDKGAQLTAMVVMQRGLVRAIFVEWSKCALKSKLAKVLAREAHCRKVHDDRLGELYRELFLLKEQNAKLQEQLNATMRRPQDGHIEEEEDGNDDDNDGRQEGIGRSAH